ncbi:D-alanyl-D-alanine carboxypeptidase family protein [Lysinibacillus xylanilyticus]|uniref:D-alanyl-D-alanine carboxypeptidase family protein n=1 Tax=Lysinibacillus xylanilyticus TaxID=582475 RepID=A0ABV3VZG1_9BACI
MIKKIVTIALLMMILIVSGCFGNEQNEQNEQQIQQGFLTVADPESITVLVNKEYAFPEGYEPKDLVYPNVPFIFNEKIEKRMMREEAAKYLEKMFNAANQQNIHLAGVSAYRSSQTQTTLFNNYVERDGIEKAKTYSAVPGTSEHQSGLAIDVSGSDGSCAADDCFANTEEAAWLEDNAHNYGYIIRFPKDKDNITGYQYEPWHIRYVGVNLATELYNEGLTLEEYYE